MIGDLYKRCIGLAAIVLTVAGCASATPPQRETRPTDASIFVGPPPPPGRRPAVEGDRGVVERPLFGPLEDRPLSQSSPAPAGLEPNDRLVAELKARQLEVRQTDRGVMVTLPDVLFEFGSADLTYGARRKVRELADVLREDAASRRIAVEGHTDSIGAALYNQGLSERRAETVADQLASDGVEKSLIAWRGFGERYPVAPNTNPDGSDNPRGRARNRRVEVIVLN